jgi:hypothetical protein
VIRGTRAGLGGRPSSPFAPEAISVLPACCWRRPCRSGADDDIAVGDHADGATVLAHWERARANILHDPRHGLDGVIRDASSTSRVITSLTFIATHPITRSGNRPPLGWATRSLLSGSAGDLRLLTPRRMSRGEQVRAGIVYFAARRRRVPAAPRCVAQAPDRVWRSNRTAVDGDG